LRQIMIEGYRAADEMQGPAAICTMPAASASTMSQPLARCGAETREATSRCEG
jgi:hypothetical protein